MSEREHHDHGPVPHEHGGGRHAPHEHAPHEHAPHEHAPHEHAPHKHGHGDDADWDAMGPMLERTAELSSPQYEEAARWIAALPTARRVRRILDIGSGPGVITCLLAEVFPEAEVVAVDGTPALLERTKARAARHGLADRVRTVHAELPGDVAVLGEADLIWAGDSLHHIGDQRAMLAGFAGLLRPGGTVALLEGGLPARHLPREIGIGRPGLESRLDAVHADVFQDMRAALPDVRHETEDWNALFTAAELEPQGTRSFLLDLPAPLSDAAREYIVTLFAMRRQRFADLLPAEDIAALDRLLDADDPAGLRHRPDVFLLSARTVHLARRAAG